MMHDFQVIKGSVKSERYRYEQLLSFFFFAGEQKSIVRVENHFKSNHIESFVYIPGILRGHLQSGHHF